MKTLKSLMALAVLGSIFVGSMGCEVSHTESDKQGWFGDTKHQETTVTKNPVTGDEHVERQESHTNP
jgi:hypothetical protein